MNFTHTLSCLNCTRNLKDKRDRCHICSGHTQIHVHGTYNSSAYRHLLVWDVDVELIVVDSRAVEFGDDLDQVIAAEQEITFACRGSALWDLESITTGWNRNWKQKQKHPHHHHHPHTHSFFFDMKVLLCHLKAAPIHGVDTHQHQPLMDTACSKVRHYTSTAAWPCSHLFESEGKETIVLRADWDTADVGQRDAGFNLTGLLVGQDNIFLRQQEDPGCSLNCDHDRYYLTICKL